MMSCYCSICLKACAGIVNSQCIVGSDMIVLCVRVMGNQNVTLMVNLVIVSVTAQCFVI